jgi:hypothetical protein
MNQLELRHEAVQCHVRAQRVANDDDAEWLRALAAKLAKMADAQDDQLSYRACRDLMLAR